MPDNPFSGDPTPLSPADLQRLRALADGEGRLSTDQLARVTPIDRMRPDAVTRLLIQLEDAGLDVEVDPVLQRPRHSPAQTDRGPPAAALQPEMPLRRAATPAEPPMQGSTLGPHAMGHADPAHSAVLRSRNAPTAIVIAALVMACLIAGWLAHAALGG